MCVASTRRLVHDREKTPNHFTTKPKVTKFGGNFTIFFLWFGLISTDYLSYLNNANLLDVDLVELVLFGEFGLRFAHKVRHTRTPVALGRD